MKKKKKRFRDPPKQPVKCKGCVWGDWTGTKQFCMMPTCTKKP
ncbi:hypothetical protein RQP50_27610 [Paenibacillus sp. chi10]|uniref:Uncharacterized protein n=1 Tax=Paenibacillus suaedae TaxID=3077233 RepID=A0AAJ2K4L8_9BACL|nr:hypothetical protein [Paenibacillus sp. chi10]MDT8980002.1 hypothetical protein [Paenibacillus sp. chi10]